MLLQEKEEEGGEEGAERNCGTGGRQDSRAFHDEGKGMKF